MIVDTFVKVVLTAVNFYGQTDGRTDRQTDGANDNTPSANCRGVKMKCIHIFTSVFHIK